MQHLGASAGDFLRFLVIEPRKQAGIGHGACQILAAQLPDGFHQTQKSCRAAGLTYRQLPAAGVDGEAAVGGQRVPAHELRPLALGAEAQVL